MHCKACPVRQLPTCETSLCLLSPGSQVNRPKEVVRLVTTSEQKASRAGWAAPDCCGCGLQPVAAPVHASHGSAFWANPCIASALLLLSCFPVTVLLFGTPTADPGG